MSLIPWRNKREEGSRGALDAVGDFRKEMDRLFESFFDEPFAWPAQALGAMQRWNPALDVSENDQEVVVKAEVPGLEPKDLNIQVAGRTLVLSGEKKEEQERQEQGCWRSERRFGSFRREVPLPPGVDPDKVSADYAHGVLTIRIGKSPAAQPRRIPIKTS